MVQLAATTADFLWRNNSLSEVIKKAAKDFVTIEDGYKVYWVENRGYLTASQLREIADELDRLNKDWDEQVKNDPIWSKQ